MDQGYAELTRLASACQDGIRGYSDLCKPLFEEDCASLLQWLVMSLSIRCCQTSESTLQLISSGHIWDSEILLRAVLEGTLKTLFLCDGDESEQEEKANEFWNSLSEIEDLKHHYRVSQFITALKQRQLNTDSDDTIQSCEKIITPLSELLLDNDVEEALRKKYPRKRRQELEQKWSFNRLIIAVFDMFPKEMLSGLSNVYAMSSHLLHQDAIGVGTVWERSQREPQRRQAVSMAHGSRQLSDLLTYAMTRAYFIHRFYKADVRPVSSLSESLKSFFAELDILQKPFYALEYEQG